MKTFPKKDLLKQRGSAILIVLLLSTALMIVLASHLRRGISTKEANANYALFYEAKDAAESFAEYGCAEVIERFEYKTSFSKNELITNPLAKPSSATGFYTNSNIDLTKSEVKGGQIGDAYNLYIDPNDPKWEFDPLKGQNATVRDINIFGKATTKKQNVLNGKTHNAYVQQTLQLRDSPLFSYAVFYNMVLEFHPGPTMTMGGPVHSNKDIYVQASGGITFESTMTSAERIIHGCVPNSKVGNQSNYVRIKNADGNKVDMEQNSKWVDHNHSDWREKSAQLWDGNVQDIVHNVPIYNAAGIPDYVEDDPGTQKVELENHAYAVIEPLLDHDHNDRKSDAMRNQKMMAKAGIIFKVEFDPTTSTGLRIRAYKWKRNNSSHPVNTQNPMPSLALNANGDPILEEIVIPNQTLTALSSDLIGSADSNITSVNNSLNGLGGIPQPELYSKPGTNVTRGLYDGQQMKEISLVTLDIGVLRKCVDDKANPTGTDLANTYWKDSDGNITYNPKTDWNGVVYVQFPLNSKSTRPGNDKIVTAQDTVKSTVLSTNPDSDFEVHPLTSKNSNGKWVVSNDRFMKSGSGVYISKADYKASHTNKEWNDNRYQFTYKLKSGVSYYHTTQTISSHLALQIINGEFVPSPTIDPSNSNNRNPGFTVATNGPLYSVGHYNADGTAHTNDHRLIEKNHYTDFSGTVNYDEPPTAFMCESYYLLSNNWKTTGRPRSAEENNGKNTCKNRPASFTEVSAAILTGLSPTFPKSGTVYPSSKKGQISGGNHNFPRFLEKWSTTLTLRTSMVALFESEVHHRGQIQTGYYSPPTRDWGFNENFKDGIFPPGTPNVRTFRRTTYKDVTEAEYIAGTQ